MLIWSETLNYWVNKATECMCFEVLKKPLWNGWSSCFYPEPRDEVAYKIYIYIFLKQDLFFSFKIIKVTLYLTFKNQSPPHVWTDEKLRRKHLGTSVAFQMSERLLAAGIYSLVASSPAWLGVWLHGLWVPTPSQPVAAARSSSSQLSLGTGEQEGQLP